MSLRNDEPCSDDFTDLASALDDLEFDNTLEEIEYILNNPPKSDKKNPSSNDCKLAEGKESELERNTNSVQDNKGKLALNAKPSAEVTPMKRAQKEKEVFATTSLSSMEFDNTLEEIEYILNNPPKSEKKNPSSNDCKLAEGKETELEKNTNSVQDNKGKLDLNAKPSAEVTPMKQAQKEKEVFATPSPVPCTKQNLCRTPVNPPLLKKPPTSSAKKTPSKNNAFQHIASPVAYYVNNTPQIPLIQNVNPKKTLPGLSTIPNVKSTAIKPSNKENVNLPSIAYKCAKKTTVIDVTNAPKMPQSQWAKKLTESLPRPAVIKHTYREKDFLNKPLPRDPDDSFGDLSLQQADVSVCTKKAAF